MEKSRRLICTMLTGFALSASLLLPGIGEAARARPLDDGPGVNGLRFPESIGGDFSLLDQNGQPFSLARLEGRYALLFFGYTHCPDVCPTALSEALKINRALPPERRVSIVFITLDPERDRPEVLKRYLAHFDPYLTGLTGLTGSVAQVADVAKLYRAAWQRQDLPGSRLGYAVNHSAYSYLLDRRGKVVLAYPYGTPHSDVVQDLIALDKRERPSIARETLSKFK